jgi:hypothetical protein
MSENLDTPIYDATTQQQGWSPREVAVALDVAALVSASYAKVADRRGPHVSAST